MDFTFLKRQLRTAAVHKRSEIAPDYARLSALGLLECFKEMKLPENPVFSAYWPMKTELDVRPLMAYLHENGFTVGLPVVTDKGEPLLFRRWEPGAELVAGPYGTEQPNEKYEPVMPNVLFLPLLAFDRSGGRLGYGGGFYDRTLAVLRCGGRSVIAAGVGFSFQEIEQVPLEDTDEKINVILTEKEIIEVF